jgi:hypothetical protein
MGLLTTVGDCPPWQVAQALVMPAWSIFALEKVLVLLWQFSQGNKVGKWFTALLITPKDWPLWQDEHPLDMPKCLKLFTRKLVGLTWQVSQELVVWTWLTGLGVAPTRLPMEWHPAQSLGVFLKMASTWHCSHLKVVCTSLNMNPVFEWSNGGVAGTGSAKTMGAKQNIMHTDTADDISIILFMIRPISISWLSLVPTAWTVIRN